MDIEGHTNVMRYCLMGFIFPFKVWIWEMLPALHNNYVRKRHEYVLPRMCGWKRNKHMDCTEVSTMSLATVEGVAPNSKMRPTKDELETDYYKRFLKYCSRKCVPDLSPPRHKKYKTQDGEDTTSTSVSVQQHSKGEGTKAPSVDPQEFLELKRTVAWLTAQHGKRPDAYETPIHRFFDDAMDSPGPRHNDGHEVASDYATENPIPNTAVEVDTSKISH